MSQHREYNGRREGLPDVPFQTNQSSAPFHIALVTAGELRSFAFVERSWERYFYHNWKSHIKIFGHIIQTNNCPLSSYGLSRFSKIATEYELSSPAPIIPSREILERLPKCLVTPEYRPRWVKRFGGFSRGNFVDMYARRKRAYELAKTYAELHLFQWDLIFFVRLDTAFYDPPINFYSIYSALKKYEETNQSPAIFIPGSCDFGGLCDRIAFGLPSTMDIYFQLNWPFLVMDMTCLSLNETAYLLPLLPTNKYEGFIPTLETIRLIKEDVTVHVPTSETMLSLWAVMNNITQLNYDKNIAFATLRVEHIPGYCNLNRHDYIYLYPNRSEFIWDPDKHAMYDLASPFRDFDLIGNYEGRCGNHTKHYDIKKICSNYPSCSCNKSFGYLYLGV